MQKLGWFAARVVLCAELAALTSGDAARAQSATQSGAVTVIRAGTLIDGVSETPRKNQLIFVRGERIVKVTGSGEAIPSGANVIDLSSSTVLPGLTDSHTHIFLWGEDPQKGGYDANILKAGIALRAARATFAARRALELDMAKGAQLVDGPVEARKAARQQLDHGADWIKVYMTHRSWVDNEGRLVSQPTLTVEELKAIVDEAHGWTKKVACHAYNGIGLQRALDGGCDSIEHGLEMTDAQIEQMKRQGTWYCPTLSPYYGDWAPADTPEGKRDRARAAAHEDTFKRALKARLKIVFGTDMGGIPWTEPIAQEFQRMVEMGMAPMDAIQAATSRPAEMLDRKGEIGVISAGAYAEVIAVSGDPLKDPGELEHVRFVMHDGAVFKNEIAK